MREVPEVDRAAWLTPEQAWRKTLLRRRPVLQALLNRSGRSEEAPGGLATPASGELDVW